MSTPQHSSEIPAEAFADAMRALGDDDTYGDVLPLEYISPVVALIVRAASGALVQAGRVAAATDIEARRRWAHSLMIEDAAKIARGPELSEHRQARIAIAEEKSRGEIHEARNDAKKYASQYNELLDRMGQADKDLYRIGFRDGQEVARGDTQEERN